MRGDRGREPVRGGEAAFLLGEELLELVDDEQDALVAGLGRELAGHGFGDPVGTGPG